MAVTDGARPLPSPNAYPKHIWPLQPTDIHSQGSQIANSPSSYLPTLVTRSYQREGHLPADGLTQRGEDNEVGGAKLTYKEFRSRVRPSIFKGKSHGVAVDPKSHLQMVREKQAMYEHRVRPKSPISLEPVQVSLSAPKSKKGKVKGKKRLSRSAPDPVHIRNPNQGLPYYQPTSPWKSENQLQLPQLSVENSSEFLLTTSSKPSRLINTHHSQSDTSDSVSRNSMQQNWSTNTRTNKSTSTFQSSAMKPLIQAFKLTQSNYAASRVTRLLNNKHRAYENETLAVTAQSCSKQEMDNILDLVEKNQQRCCAKHNGRRSCGICPNTATSRRDLHNGPERKENLQNLDKQDNLQTESRQLPEVEPGNERRPDGDKTRRELVVQLPNIMQSRANTPAASAVADRVARLSNVATNDNLIVSTSAFKGRRTTNTPADGFFTDHDDSESDVNL